MAHCAAPCETLKYELSDTPIDELFNYRIFPSDQTPEIVDDEMLNSPQTVSENSNSWRKTMSEHQFVVTDIDFQPFKDDTSQGSMLPIKEEVVKDDDILFLTEDIDAFNPTNPNFEIENIGEPVSLPENTTFHINFTDDQMNQMLSGESLGKFDMNNLYKTEVIKSDRPLSHMVKYKMQDGKHTKVWQCGVCQKEFGHQYILMRHLPTHTDERKFQCNTCGKAFRQMSTLSQHRAIHSAERPYVCEICQKTFNRVSTLISHRKTHTGLKPHRCHLCNKAFHQKGNLRNHIFTHTNERPYKCDVCSKGFNQMSNLMCHKLKAHQRSDKPRYTCQTCGKDFQKRMGLRNHEQYEHGDVVAGSGNGSPRIRYTNGVIVDPINTMAMQHALATNQTPFALLRPLNGIPVLVRVLAAGNKQMLVPATAEDLKKHGQITITPKTEDVKTEDRQEVENKEEKAAGLGDGHENGSTVQIRIPVVATVIQRCDKDGSMCMDVESPGPGPDGIMNDNFMYTTTTNVTNSNIDITEVTKQDIITPNSLAGTSKQEDPKVNKIEYFDLTTIDEENKNQFFNQNFSYTTVEGFNNNLQFENNIINLTEANPEADNNTVHLYSSTGEVFDLPSDSSTRIYQLLEKPQPISLNETDAVLDSTNFLVDNNLGDQTFTIL